MDKYVALRVCVDKDEDIEELNKYLNLGYKIIDKTEITPRFLDTMTTGGVIYYAAIIYILEKC